MDGEYLRRLLRWLEKHYGLGLAASVLAGVLSFFVILFVTLGREGPLPTEPAARSALVAPPRPPAEPSPFAYCRDALKAPERVEALPLPNLKDVRVLIEQQRPDIEEVLIEPEYIDPCGGEPFPMDRNGCTPYWRVNPWALSLRGFERTPRCRGRYPFSPSLNSGTCHSPRPD